MPEKNVMELNEKLDIVIRELSTVGYSVSGIEKHLKRLNGSVSELYRGRNENVKSIAAINSRCETMLRFYDQSARSSSISGEKLTDRLDERLKADQRNEREFILKLVAGVGAVAGGATAAVIAIMQTIGD